MTTRILKSVNFITISKDPDLKFLKKKNRKRKRKDAINLFLSHIAPHHRSHSFSFTFTHRTPPLSLSFSLRTAPLSLNRRPSPSLSQLTTAVAVALCSVVLCSQVFIF
ncbi:hypothetical protein P8452_31654 [Trifolium repens]|nr:hypothetical protein P8452_31654 [Trifolium repens]